MQLPKPVQPFMALALCLGMASLTTTACAQPSTDLQARGAAIAQARCSVCHAVGPTGPSPAPANADTPFHRLHERYPIPMLEEAARTGIVTGHDEMPGFEFSMDEIEALLAYIDALSPDKPGYLKR